jgi:hypothetical protein
VAGAEEPSEKPQCQEQQEITGGIGDLRCGDGQNSDERPDGEQRDRRNQNRANEDSTTTEGCCSLR